MMTNCNDAVTESSRQEFKTGDRLWVWTDAPPSEFERHISHLLGHFDPENGVFYVRIYSWAGAYTDSSPLIHLPRKIEVAQYQYIGFFHVNGPMRVTILQPCLTFSRKALAGSIFYASRQFCFEDQNLIIFACRQHEHDAEPSSLRGSFDAVGLLSIIFGKNILSREVLSSYFCTTRQKFISGELELTKKEAFDQHVFGLSSFFGIDEFSAEDKTLHASLWFAGRAFAADDHASKIVYYNTALELIAGKSMANHFGRIYKGKVREAVLEKLKEINDLRNELLHNGEQVSMTENLERFIHVLLLDAMVYKHQGSLLKSAFESLWHEGS